MLIFSLVLVAVFHRSLLELLRYSWESDVYSYILLIPVISAYLVWLKRAQLMEAINHPPSRQGAFVPAVFGALLVALDWAAPPGVRNDQIALSTGAFLAFFLSGCWWFLGRPVVFTLAFPLGLLALMVPLPSSVADGFTQILQQASADVSYALLKVAGDPVFRNGLVFQLPGLTIQVAEECSGIRSTLVLFITSLVAGYMFLTSRVNRALIALAALSLGVLRNGFRIFLIASLSVHVDPAAIDSPLHHRGGPLFFIVSLLPLFLLLLVLRRIEKRRERDRATKGVPGAPQAYAANRS